MAVASDPIVCRVQYARRYDVAQHGKEPPHTAEVARDTQRAARLPEQPLVRGACGWIVPDQRIDTRELRMSIAQRGAERTFESREAERPPLALVPQHELHGARAESARSIVEKNRAVASQGIIRHVANDT